VTRISNAQSSLFQSNEKVKSSCQKLPHWSSVETPNIRRQDLLDLFEGRLAALIIPRRISEQTCNILISRLQKEGMSKYSHVNAAVDKFGLVQAEHNRPELKDAYFEKVLAANRASRALYKGVCEDPLKLIMNDFRREMRAHITIAKEQDFGNYFAGTFRLIKGAGLIHYDFANSEVNGWEISKVVAQLSWNLYLSRPVSGGELIVYSNQWNPQSEIHKKPLCYSYFKSAVDDAAQFSYSPNVGDLVIFNSRNFHEIKPPVGLRYSLSSFIGLLRDSQIIFWS
jgi:hypothetical protein